MSKPIKNMISRDLQGRLQDVTSVAVCGFTGLNSEQTYAMRTKLAEKDINFTVVKNSLAKRAFKEVGLDTASELLEGPCALAFGSDSIVSVVRELLDINKESKELTVKGAILDGEVFSGPQAVDQLSKFPTREEAISQLVQCVLSAGSNVAGCLAGPGGQIAGILKKIEEDKEG